MHEHVSNNRLSVAGIERIQNKIDEIEKKPFKTLYANDKKRMSQKPVNIESYDIYRMNYYRNIKWYNVFIDYYIINNFQNRYMDYFNKKNEGNKNIMEDKNQSIEHSKLFNHSEQDIVFFDLLR
jgi:hypothetical protein